MKTRGQATDLSAPTGNRALLRAAGVVGLLTLISRAVGFLREILIARAFGTSADGSAIVVAQTVPNLSRALASEEVAQGALVPPLSRLLTEDRAREARRVALLAGAASTVLLVLLSLAVMVAASTIVALVAPAAGDVRESATPLLRALAPAIAINGILAAASALLVTERRFGVVGAGALVSNIPVTAWLLVDTEPAVMVIALLIAAGYVLQAVWLAGAVALDRRWLPNEEPLLTFSLSRFDRQQLALVGRLAFPVTLSLGMASLSGVVDIAFSTMVGDGGPAALDKAFRLVLLPYGVFALAIGIVALPSLVAAAMRSDSDFDRQLLDVTRLQAVLLVPIAVAIVFLAPDLVELAYERGEFTQASSNLTSNALIGACIALPTLGISLVGTRAWVSKQRPWVPAGVAVAGLVLNAVLNAVLIGPFGLAGIGMATAVAHGTVGGILILTAGSDRREFGRVLSLFAVRLSVVVSIAAAVGFGVSVMLRSSLPELVAYVIAIATAIAALLPASRMLGLPDFLALASVFRRRTRSRSDASP